MTNNFNQLISLCKDMTNNYIQTEIDLIALLPLIESSIFELSEAQFIYDNDLILTLITESEPDFIGEIRFMTYKKFIVDIYCYRV